MIRKASPKPRVVIVDDEEDFLTIVRDWLEPDYEVVTFTDGIGLHERLDSLEPDALILDVRLPGPDGFKICREIATDWRFQQMPILFLSASRTDADFVRNLAAGGTCYLTKPISRAELLRDLRAAMALATPSV